MVDKNISNLSFDWVLNNKLALGKSPNKDKFIETLIKLNIKSVLTLCSYEEGKLEHKLSDSFFHDQIILPDHKSKRPPTVEEIDITIQALAKLMHNSPVYVHCVASAERSPLVCIAWMVRDLKIEPHQAINYLKDIHKETSLYPDQINAIKNYHNFLNTKI